MAPIEYTAQQYDEKEWGVFARSECNWMVFGTEAEMKRRADDLNAEFTDDDDVDFDDYPDDDDRSMFADPGGNSALRAETPDNPRDCACPQCGSENVLTRLDRRLGYRCDSCADRAERGWD